jgi:protein TonB
MGLDEQAILAIRQWKFQPAMKNGKPVRVQIEIQMDFRCCP